MASTAGTLNTAAQVWNKSGTYVAKDDASGTVDKLVMTGLTVAAGFTVNVQTATAGGSVPNGTYVLATDTGAAQNTDPFGTGQANGTTSGTAALLTLQTERPGGPGGYSVQSANDTSSLGGVDLDLVVTAAPEPTSLLLASVAIVPLLGRRRRVG